MSPYAVGLKIGILGRGKMSIALSPHRTGKRRGLLDLEQIANLAAILKCDKKTTDRLMILGGLEFAPAYIGTYVENLERQLDRR